MLLRILYTHLGRGAVSQLLEQRAVDVLLKVLKQHEHETTLSTVTDLAVKALEKFMDEPNGRQAFLRGGGIQSLVAVLKLSHIPRSSDVKSFTTIILVRYRLNSLSMEESIVVLFFGSRFLDF